MLSGGCQCDGGGQVLSLSYRFVQDFYLPVFPLVFFPECFDSSCQITEDAQLHSLCI